MVRDADILKALLMYYNSRLLWALGHVTAVNPGFTVLARPTPLPRGEAEAPGRADRMSPHDVPSLLTVHVSAERWRLSRTTQLLAESPQPPILLSPFLSITLPRLVLFTAVNIIQSSFLIYILSVYLHKNVSIWRAEDLARLVQSCSLNANNK